MSQPVRISLDAMGGDHGPSVVVPGAALALERHPTLRFLMFGNERTITPLVEADARLKGAVEIHHTEVAVSMDDKPSQARPRRAGQVVHVAGRAGGARRATPTPRSRPATPAR